MRDEQSVRAASGGAATMDVVAVYGRVWGFEGGRFQGDPYTPDVAAKKAFVKAAFAAKRDEPDPKLPPPDPTPQDPYPGAPDPVHPIREPEEPDQDVIDPGEDPLPA